MLTQIAIKNAKPEAKPYKLADARGLYLLVHPNGGKYWRWKYRFERKERVLALGVFPEVGLADARDKQADARKLLKDDIDPNEARRTKPRKADDEAKNSFQAVAHEWLEIRKSAWSEYYSRQVLQRLQLDIFPAIGAKDINSINAREVLEIARSIESRGALEMAHRAVQICGKVFVYGIVTERCIDNPAKALRGALRTATVKHNPHLSDQELGGFMTALEKYDGGTQTKLAIRFLVLTFVRTSELCKATWDEISFERREWRIPATRMKMKRPHIVPLSNQAMALLDTLHKLNGHREYVFPSVQSPRKPMSNNTMLYALYTMGYKGKTTGHGFRAMASTILNESGEFSRDVIERQLAHQERNRVRAAYDHSEHLPARREMMQWWADYVESQYKTLTVTL
jgi:integrase